MFRMQLFSFLDFIKYETLLCIYFDTENFIFSWNICYLRILTTFASLVAQKVECYFDAVI